MVVGLLLDKLWSHVQGGPLDGCEDHGVAGHGPGKPKVAELDDAIGPDQDVLRLHVPVDDAVGVQIVQGPHQLLGNPLHHLLW